MNGMPHWLERLHFPTPRREADVTHTSTSPRERTGRFSLPVLLEFHPNPSRAHLGPIEPITRHDRRRACNTITSGVRHSQRTASRLKLGSRPNVCSTTWRSCSRSGLPRAAPLGPDPFRGRGGLRHRGGRRDHGSRRRRATDPDDRVAVRRGHQDRRKPLPTGPPGLVQVRVSGDGPTVHHGVKPDITA